MVDQNIKKVRILKKDLPNYVGNNDELFYQMRYRVISEDKNRSSHWSPIHKLGSTSTDDETGFDINNIAATNISHNITIDKPNHMASITWTKVLMFMFNGKQVVLGEIGHGLELRKVFNTLQHIYIQVQHT